MTAKAPGPRAQETPAQRVDKAIELLKRIKNQSIYVEGEGRKHNSQRLVQLSHEIDVDCTDALNALYGVKV
jgi:thiamine pyrophosphate-dependent acetolactate synthase large subunit-like protein